MLIGTDILPQLGYLFIQSTMEGEDLNLLENKYHISSDKQEGASEAPDMNGNYEDSTDVVLGSNCNPALSNDDHDISGVVGIVHLIQPTKLTARHKKMVRKSG